MSIAEVVELPAHLVANGMLLPNRFAMLEILPKNAIIVEVGVGLGVFSEAAISVCRPQRYVAIDNFRLHELPSVWGHKPKELFGGRTHADYYRARFSTVINSGQMQIVEADSHDGLAQLDDASVDIVYIDADHSYAAVARDLEIAQAKVRPDGYIIVNDYILVDGLNAASCYGVIPATNEFMIKYNWRMQYFVLQTLMFCDVVLRQSERPRIAEPNLEASAPNRREARFEGQISAFAAAVARETSLLWKRYNADR